MTSVTETKIAVRSSRASRSELLRVLKLALRSRQGKFGGGLALLVFFVAFVGPFIPGNSPTALVAKPFASPSGGLILGADALGRDVLARTLAGGWALLTMALLATVLALAVGTIVGMTAAYLGSFWDGIIMRSVDVLLAFPQLVFALLLVSIVGPKVWLIVVAIAITHFPQVARIVRSATLDVAERDFVRASEALGIPRPIIMVRDILPNLSAPLLVEAGLRLTYSIIFMAGLSFLGLGRQPPAADWGIMINENRLGLSINPASVLVPAIIIGMLTIGVNLFTDAVSDASSSGTDIE